QNLKPHRGAGYEKEACVMRTRPILLILIAGLVMAADRDRVENPASRDGLENPAGAPRPGPVVGYHKGVVGGPHDLTETFGFGSACNSCHVPHVQAVRTTTQPATQPAFEMFRIGGQRRVFQPDYYMPGPTSLLCLGCHDGTIATSTMGTSHALRAGMRAGFTVPEGFVWRDHPIGVPYPPAAGKDYRPKGYVEKLGIPLPEGRIECISCHDPHDTHGH